MLRIACTTLALLSLVGCDKIKGKPTDAEQVSGVWKMLSGEMLLISVNQAGFDMVSGDTYIPFIPESNDTPGDGSLSAKLNGGDHTAIWTFQVAPGENGISALTLTMHDGTQSRGTLVRRLTDGDNYAMDVARHPAPPKYADE